MSDKEKLLYYETHIEDMLHVLQERMAEFKSSNDYSDFEQGRQMAYWEVMDMIKTRHSMILELIEDVEE